MNIIIVSMGHAETVSVFSNVYWFGATNTMSPVVNGMSG